MLSKAPARHAADNEDAEEVRAKPKMPRFGVAIFDNPRDPVGGWGCLSDAPSFRFRQPSDLPADCIWVCSVESSEFGRTMSKLRHLRQADFFRSSLKQIAADIGLHIDGEGRFGDVAKVAAPALAKVVHRAALVAVQVYGWNEPTQMLQGDTLSDDIRKAIIAPPPIRSHMRAPLLSAYQSYSSPHWPSEYEPDSIVVTLRSNRLAYAKRVMLTPVPDGAWMYVDTDAGFNLASALNEDSPCLVEAAIETSGIDPAISSLVAYGAAPGRRTGLRSWMSQPELRWVSEHAKVTVVRAYRTNGSTLLPERVQLPEMLTSDPLFELSLSAGLVAECHWAAFCKTTFTRAVEKKEISPWGVWLRSADRAMSFQLALAAHKANFAVLGYGNGTVVVRLQRARLPELLEFAMVNNIAHPVFREIFETNGMI